MKCYKCGEDTNSIICRKCEREEETCEICGEELNETQNNKHNHEDTENCLGGYESEEND